MVPSPRTLLLGRERSRFDRSLEYLFVATLFAATLAAYALGVFAVGGGVVFLPGEAALVGLTAATVLASRRSGLAVAWLAVYAALLGYSADHYLLSLSGRSLGEKLAAFLQVDGLAVLGLAALVLGTLAWGVGSLTAVTVDVLLTDGSRPDR